MSEQENKVSIRVMLHQNALSPETKKAETEKQIEDLQRKLKTETYRGQQMPFKKRHQRLCIRGGMLQRYFHHPGQVSNDEIKSLLILAFSLPEIQKMLARQLDEARQAILDTT